MRDHFLKNRGKRLPHSPQNTIKKSRQACLSAIFLLCFATPRRRRGGMSERSDEIPESEGMSLALAFLVARAPRRAARELRTQ